MSLPLISLIVPCYNEEDSLPFFYEAFFNLAQKMSEQVCFEVVCVNDGSKDNTFAIIQELMAKDERLHYISFTRNFGKEAAMFAGLQHARGDYVVIADADMQHPIEMIEQMYSIIQDGEYDSVAARRASRTGEPRLRSFCAKQFYALINVFSDIDLVDGATDFRLMPRQMLESILELQEYNRFSKGIFSFVGYRTKWIEYKNVERAVGETKWSFYSLLKYSLEGIFAFTTAPLHLASVLGLIISFFSLFFIMYVVVQTIIFGNPVQGYPTLFCVITFLGGIQLFCTGILSEYISKIYSEIKKRPVYIVKETSFTNTKLPRKGIKR